MGSVNQSTECDLCRSPAAYETEDGRSCRAHRAKLIGLAVERFTRAGHPFPAEAAEALVYGSRIVRGA
jgi:hypothetical protein